MPWEKQFDEDEVLDNALQAFWRGGYNGTSMKTLVEKTGLNPGSLYAAFSDKRGLFERCMAHYEEQAESRRRELARGCSPREAILGLFDLMLEDVRDPTAKVGCFLVNSSLEAGRDPDFAAVVSRGMANIETFIRERITAGQATGDIAADRDPAETARLILGILAGARVMARLSAGHPFVAESRAHARRLLSGNDIS